MKSLLGGAQRVTLRKNARREVGCTAQLKKASDSAKKGSKRETVLKRGKAKPESLNEYSVKGKKERYRAENVDDERRGEGENWRGMFSINKAEDKSGGCVWLLGCGGLEGEIERQRCLRWGGRFLQAR